MTNMTRRNFTRTAALSTALSYSRISSAPTSACAWAISDWAIAATRSTTHSSSTAISRRGLRPARRCIRTSPSGNRARHRRNTPTTARCSTIKGWTRWWWQLPSLARTHVHRRLQRRQGCVCGEASFPDGGRGPQNGGGGAAHGPRVAGGHAAPIHGVTKEAAEIVRSGGIGHVTVARSLNDIGNEWPHGIGDPPDGDPPRREGVGPVARSRAEGAVQQEPFVLQVPLVLQSSWRPAHQLRRPQHRHDPLGVWAWRSGAA